LGELFLIPLVMMAANSHGNASALTSQWDCITMQDIPLFESESVMSATLEVESTLTDRYQTTVPETVRRALRLGKRDKIHYTIRPSGEVVLTRVESSEGDDPVLGQFLGFLARDIASHPERLQAIDASLVPRIQSLVGGIEVDLDAALSADDE
jgi:antitoxin PrlF